MDALAAYLSKIALKLANPKVYGAGAVLPDPHWRMAPHCHPFHELIAIRKGRLILQFENQALTATSGEILLYRPGFVHEEISDRRNPAHILYLGFDPGEQLSSVPLKTRDTHGRIGQMMSWLIEDERDRRAPETKLPLLETLVGELRHVCSAPRDPWLEENLAFIRGNMTRELSLDDLAVHGKMSKFAFVRKFKRLRGRTPMEELRLARLNQARNLLLTTNLPVKSIAPAVGIGDEYQLSKLFRAHFDLSPRDLRSRSFPVSA